jgi:hypothetical protein
MAIKGNAELTQRQMLRTKFKDQYESDYQQLATRVQQYTTVETGMEGDYYEFPIIGGTEMREYNDTRHRIEEDDVRFAKRGMRYRKFYNAIPISKDEVRDMGKYEYTLAHIKQQQLAAAKRMLDAVALGVVKDASTGKWRLKKAGAPESGGDGGYCGGILGVNYGGDGGIDHKELDLTIESYLNHTGNLVPVDYATGGSKSTISPAFNGTFLDKISYVRRRLEELDVFDPTEPGALCVCISPAVKQMIQALELKLNRDYGFSTLGEAGTTTYLSKTGITWVVSNMLPTMDTKTIGGQDVTGARMCCAWLKNRIGFGVWDDWEYRIQDLTEMVDVRERSIATGYFGCGRKDEHSVFVLPELETNGII